jgi:hypothetical protein
MRQLAADMTIQLVALEDRAFDRGLVLGTELRERIHGHVDAWLCALRETGIGEPRAYVRDFVRETNFCDAIATLTPDLLEEVRGIAEGSQLPWDIAFALQLMDEEWAFRARRGAKPTSKCSSAAIVSRDRSTWIGQNMDLGQYTDGFQVLLQIATDEEKPEALIFSTAGMIGLIGVNAAGIGVCVNALPQLPSRATGLPVAFVLRKLLQTQSFDAAVALVRTIPHATNQHYLIAAPGRIGSFEASAEGLTEYCPSDSTRVLHTNHPLAAAIRIATSEDFEVNSMTRLRSLTNRLGSGEAEFEEVAETLGSSDDPAHPVCRLPSKMGSGSATFTSGSMISSLRASPKEIASWVSAGPPTRGYARFILA